ncbi:hypothetical protein MKZ38_001615 [Zalerion maritima]|uniref:Uncharacterized protein n=1 Tax=Zalerion maritima TaxID=339359 RepID=A0AAD5RFD4_9PEZI|nr:hypothetical protein MKZ38_001615 [Zalerion maritima]
MPLAVFPRSRGSIGYRSRRTGVRNHASAVVLAPSSAQQPPSAVANQPPAPVYTYTPSAAAGAGNGTYNSPALQYVPFTAIGPNVLWSDEAAAVVPASATPPPPAFDWGPGSAVLPAPTGNAANQSEGPLVSYQDWAQANNHTNGEAGGETLDQTEGHGLDDHTNHGPMASDGSSA